MDSATQPKQSVTQFKQCIAPSSQYDVAVIGAGPQGLLYASWLKLARPHARIIVLERSLTPQHKIGESTLSGFCKALRSVGIQQEVLRSLFFPKNGLGFFHIDESVTDLAQAQEYILETFDETFQVERRVLDSLLLVNARRLGVEVLQGARVNLKRSSLSRSGNQIAYHWQQQDCQLSARLLVDASGPASVLAHHLDTHTKGHATFQNNAVWGYFKNMRRLGDRTDWQAKAQFARDEYTQHLCFQEGWLWYIPLVSWQDTPDAELQTLLEQLLTSTGTLPSQQALVEQFNGAPSDVISIGMVLRDDRDTIYKQQGPQAVFKYYSQKYPAIAQLLDGAELIAGHYTENQHGYMTRANIRSQAQQMSGDGYLIVGDAAFFVDPLISPGLTGGVATAYFAAQESLRVLDGAEASRQTLINYERFAKRLHEALERDNQLVYMSFNHPESLKLIQRFQEIDARRHFHQHVEADYSLVDTNVWGILSPQYQKMQQKLWAVMHQAELDLAQERPMPMQSTTDYESMVSEIHNLLFSYLKQHEELTPYVTQNAA
ncbi:MAG: hypothetical protein Kow00121_23540 [Elainellaceae cyanobacterium]